MLLYIYEQYHISFSILHIFLYDIISELICNHILLSCDKWQNLIKYETFTSQQIVKAQVDK